MYIFHRDIIKLVILLLSDKLYNEKVCKEILKEIRILIKLLESGK